LSDIVLFEFCKSIYNRSSILGGNLYMPELRKDPVIGRWVIISIERSRRPRDSYELSEKDNKKTDPENCPFCAGNEEMTPPEILAVRNNNSLANTPGWDIRVVPNKFPALRVEGNLDKEGTGMFDKMNGIGAHEVIIETPKHEYGIQEHSYSSWNNVLEVYRARINDLKKDIRLKYILVFRNEGELAGASLDHPHSQLIATPIIPKRVQEELYGAQKYHNYKDRCVFCDIIREEIRQKERLVLENDFFVAFCPFAARFPFEIWILPKDHQADFENTPQEKMPYLAELMVKVQRKLNKALNKPHYNYILHTGPVRVPKKGYWESIDSDYHWHIEVMPKLSRVAGFEWGSGFYINSTSPEVSADFLRQLDV